MPKATPNPDQVNPSPNGAPFLLAGFDPRQIRPRLPARGRRVTAPAQAGAAGLLASASGRAPCLRACALRQSDRENAPPERFQAVLWGRNDGRRCGVVSGGVAWDRASTSFSGIAFEYAEVLPLPPLRPPRAIPAPDRPIADLRWRRFGRSADDVHSCIILDMMLLHRLCLHRAHPFLLAGFDRRQVGALPRRPRLPAPGRRVSAPAQAGATGLLASGLLLPRPALARSAFGPDDLPLADRPGGPHPLACGLAPCGNRTVKTLPRSVFRRSSGGAVGARLRGR